MPEVVDLETGEVLEPMGADEAKAITREIRIGLDAMADEYARVMPMIRDAFTRQAHAALGYQSTTEYVAREFGDTLERLDVEARRGVVHELSAAGMTERAIARVVGVSQPTVFRDRRSPTDSYESLEVTPTTTGLNGKTYQRPPRPDPVSVRQESAEDAERRQIDQGRRDTITRIAECVRFLDGGTDYGQIFLTEFYPHEVDYLPPGMRLTRDRIDSCLQFLQTIRPGVTR